MPRLTIVRARWRCRCWRRIRSLLASMNLNAGGAGAYVGGACRSASCRAGRRVGLGSLACRAAAGGDRDLRRHCVW